MNDDMKMEFPEEGENFAELFESYSSGMNENIQVGDQIRGKVISIGTNTIFVDTGTKVDGVVEKAELLNEEGQLDLSEGDELDLYVVEASESEIRLSKAISGIGGLNMLQDAWEQRIPVEGKVVSVIKGGFQVEMIKRRAFCPISQMDLTYVEDPEIYVGQTFPFLIKRFEERGKNIVVSRRDILQKEVDASRQAFMAELDEEKVYEGAVVRIMPFGAFVSLAPGVEGLVHISELSWSRLDTPEQAVAVGDRLQVKLLGVKAGEKPGTQKISLSVKQALSDPWGEAPNKIRVGDKIEGKVTRCANFGAFVELFPGIEGLVHISEMSYTRRILRPEEVVSPGDAVMVMIKEFDPDRKRISLSIKDAEGDPWADIDEKFKLGSSVQGVVEKREKFGIFVNLAPGITGLLPKSKIASSEKAATIESLKPGTSIAVTIDSVNKADRKISLGTGEGSVDQGWQEYTGTAAGSLGSLGDKLKQALSQQKKGRLMVAQCDFYDLVIIGGGPGGLSAAIYAMRAALKTVLVEKGVTGGQVTMSDEVENYPGFTHISGAELSMKFTQHAQSYDLEMISQEVTSLDPGLTHHTVVLANGESLKAHAVILATGGSPKKLDIPGEREFYGKGVSYCATCDGFFFRGKTVVVVGGGDSAAEEALYLAKLCKKVYIAHRRDELRASKILQQRIFDDCNIEMLWNTVLSEIKAGEDGVNGVALKDTVTDEARDLDVEGVFVFVGFHPNNELVPAGTRMNADGMVVTDEKCETNTPGIYVIGDLREKFARQIVLSAADGCTSALAAAHFVEAKKSMGADECTLPPEMDE